MATTVSEETRLDHAGGSAARRGSARARSWTSHGPNSWDHHASQSSVNIASSDSS